MGFVIDVLWGLAAISVFTGIFALLQRFNRIHEPPPSPKAIEQARDAAFQVIEASLKSQRELWQPRFNSINEKVYWLANQKAGLALWVGDGPSGLYVFKQKAEDKKKIVPPAKWKARLYTAAAAIISDTLAENECLQLEEMVASFEKSISSVRKEIGHDQARA